MRTGVGSESSPGWDSHGWRLLPLVPASAGVRDLPVLDLLRMFGALAQLDGSFQVLELWVCVADLVQICPTILVVFFSTWGRTGAIPCQVVGGVPSCWVGPAKERAAYGRTDARRGASEGLP